VDIFNFTNLNYRDFKTQKNPFLIIGISKPKKSFLNYRDFKTQKMKEEKSILN